MKKKKKKGNIIAVGTGLEGFLDWVDLNPSDSVEEGENDMSSLAVGLGEDYLDFEVSREKFPKWSGPNEEAQKSPAIIAVDSPERSSDALPTLEVSPRMLPERLVHRWRIGYQVRDFPTLIEL